MKKAVARKNETGNEECPFTFKWGTFCVSCWNLESSKTLVDIRPAIAGQIVLKSSAPSKITIDLGPHDVLAVLGRAKAESGLIEEQLTIRSNLPGFPETTADIVMKAENLVFFHNLRLTTLPIVVEKSQSSYCETIWLSYIWKGQELGKIPMEVKMEIENEQKSKK
jgi:hypothetical protein